MAKKRDDLQKSQLRTINHQRFAKFRALKSYTEAHKKLVDGMPISEIARWLHEDQKEYTEVARISLVTILTEYRKAVPRSQFIQRFKDASQDLISDEELKSFDALCELEKLYRIQLERISIDFNTERRINKLFPSLTQEMRTAREMLSSYIEHQMDLGVTQRQLGKIDIDAKLVADVKRSYGSEDIAKALSKPESRQKMLNVSDKLLKFLNSGGDLKGLLDKKPVIDVTPVNNTPDESAEALPDNNETRE